MRSESMHAILETDERRQISTNSFTTRAYYCYCYCCYYYCYYYDLSVGEEVVY